MIKNINKIQKPSAPDLVSEEIKSMISKKIWKVGEKIPSENELADAYGVNRFTIRMALQKLNTLGLLETRVGDGTYVRDFSFDDHIRGISDLYMSNALLDNIGEFRNILETNCLKLALQRASESELTDLHDKCQRFEDIANAFLQAPLNTPVRNSHFSELNDTDIEIHYLLCLMSHNELLSYAFSTAKEVIREHMATIGYQRLISLTKAEDLQSLREHWKIYEILKTKPVNGESLLADLIENHVAR